MDQQENIRYIPGYLNDWTYGCDAFGGVVDLDVAAEAASCGHSVVKMRGRDFVGVLVIWGCVLVLAVHVHWEFMVSVLICSDIVASCTHLSFTAGYVRRFTLCLGLDD